MPHLKKFNKGLEKTENETNLNQIKNEISFAIQDCEVELQNWDINDTFALINGFLSKTLSTFFSKKKKNRI